MGASKTFKPFLKTKLLPLLKEHVVGPAKRGKVNSNLTNNNSESANRILKSSADWTMNTLPKFTRSLYDIVIGEQNEILRSMKDMGYLKLNDTFEHHYINIDHWPSLSQDQHSKCETKFLSDKGLCNIYGWYKNHN